MAAVAISGYYGYGNSGDEAVLAGIVGSIRSQCSDVELIALTADVESTQTMQGIAAASRVNPAEVFRTIRQSDLLISGGGSLLQNVTSVRSLDYYLGVLKAAQILKKKTMVFAQGIGPIKGYFSRMATRRVLNRVDVITVRDEASRQYLMDMGVARPPIYVTADPSFAVELSEDVEVESILKAADVPQDVPLIGVCLRPWEDKIEWLPSVFRGLETAAAKIGATLVFLPMQRDQDIGISVQLASRSAQPAVVIGQSLSPSQTLSIIGKMSMVVGMRLHSLIFATSLGIPFVGLSYDPKVEAFVRIAMNHDPLILREFRSADVLTRIMDTWERREDISRNLRDRAVKLRASASESAAIACNLLKPVTKETESESSA